MTTAATSVPTSPATPAAPAIARLALTDPRWTDLAANAADATPFHHPAWSGVLSETYGFTAFGLALLEGGRAVAGAPCLEVRTLTRRRRWISLPFTDECAPIEREPGARDRFQAALADGAHELGAPSLEVRSDIPELTWGRTADAVTHVLPLEADLAAVRSRFSRSQVIRNIARAEREGVTVHTARSGADVAAFLDLHLRTRRRQGVPMQPRRFFDLLRRDVLDAGMGSIVLASSGGVPVAGALFLSWNGTTIYKFGASDPESWPLRPNHLIFWTAIQEAVARGDHRFDFGRTDLDNAGLRAFKRGWGGVERPLVTSVLGDAHGHAPGVSGRVLGAAIRGGPDWVCRGVGSALYRYAASR